MADFYDSINIIATEVNNMQEEFVTFPKHMIDAENIINANFNLVAKLFENHLEQYDVRDDNLTVEYIARKLTDSYFCQQKVTLDAVTVAESFIFYEWNELNDTNNPFYNLIQDITKSSIKIAKESGKTYSLLDVKIAISEAFEKWLHENGYIFYWFGDFSYIIAKITNEY